MDFISEYTIVDIINIKDVNNKLKDGWICQGGICVCTPLSVNMSDSNGVNNILNAQKPVFIQAMIKHWDSTTKLGIVFLFLRDCNYDLANQIISESLQNTDNKLLQMANIKIISGLTDGVTSNMLDNLKDCNDSYVPPVEEVVNTNDIPNIL